MVKHVFQSVPVRANSEEVEAWCPWPWALSLPCSRARSMDKFFTDPYSAFSFKY